MTRMDKPLLYLAITAAIWPFFLWIVGWLLLDEFRERRRARLAAREAWEWLHAQCRHRLCTAPPITAREPQPHGNQRLPVRG